jgi:phage tail sheath protein FI
MAAQAYVFAPNSPETCVTIKSMLTVFLKNQWYAGALQGATEDEAFAVDVTPGATQASNDNMGEIDIVVHVAVARPAEFIIIHFTQEMQTS